MFQNEVIAKITPTKDIFSKNVSIVKGTPSKQVFSLSLLVLAMTEDEFGGENNSFPLF